VEPRQGGDLGARLDLAPIDLSLPLARECEKSNN
jgi:hypothetical protein